MGVSSFLPPVQIVKSVQRGVAAYNSTNITVAAFNPAKAMLLVEFAGIGQSNSPSGYVVNGTTIYIAAGSGDVAWQLVEYA